MKNICIEGNREIAEEVMDQIALWDQAIIQQQIDHITQFFSDQVSLFDVGSQIVGLRDYRREWEKFSPYFSTHIDIVRGNIKIHVATDLAVMHCLTKVIDTTTKTTLVPWCRTTLCLQKTAERWLLVHQHISVPVNMQTGNIVLIRDTAKLRLVV